MEFIWTYKNIKKNRKLLKLNSNNINIFLFCVFKKHGLFSQKEGQIVKTIKKNKKNYKRGNIEEAYIYTIQYN